MATPRHDPTELAPRIEIFDQNEVLQHTFETEKASLEVKDPQPTNLIAHIKFNDDVVDSKGDNHGTVTGTTTFVDAKKGRAFSFNATSYVTLANEANFDRERTDTFSVAFLIRATIRNGDVIVAKGDNSTGGRWKISLRATLGTVRFILHNGTVNIRRDNITPIDDGKWHHILCTYDGGSETTGMHVYFDGVLEDGEAAGATLTGSILNAFGLTIGADGVGAKSSTGDYDDVRFYDSELTAADAIVLAGVTQDLKISDIVLEQGVGSNWSKLVVMINDHDNTLTKNTVRRESTIERQWRIKLQLGKSSAESPNFDFHDFYSLNLKVLYGN